MTTQVEPRRSQPLAAAPHVLLLGGQDTPHAQQLLSRFDRARDARWPAHQLSALAWPTATRHAVLQRAGAAEPRARALHEARSARSCWLPRPLDRLLALGVTRGVAALDRQLRVEDGRPRGLTSRAVYRFTRFSVDALYGERGRELVQLTATALRAAPDSVVVAHSFGGTLALRAAWELALAGELCAPRLELLALGTGSGLAVVRAPLWHGVPRDAAGRIALPPCIRRFRHFYSHSDALVAAPTLPRQFADVELIEVDTGGFARRGFGHALVDYLKTPEVSAALHEALTRSEP